MGKGQFSPTEKKPDRNGQRGKSSDSGNGSKEVNDYVPPPDGGWGWMVVFSSFLIHVIADGIVYSFGVFLMEFVDYFKAGRGAVSWIGALQPAVTFTVCFILAPLTELLVHEYSWQGAMLILGGIILNVVVCGIIFRPLESSGRSTRKDSTEAESVALLSNTDQEERELLKGGDIVTVEAVVLLSKKPLNDDSGQGDGDRNKSLTAAETFEIINSLQAMHVLPNGTAALVTKDNSENTEIVNRASSFETNVNSNSGDSEKGNNKYLLSASHCEVNADRYQNLASFASSDSALHKQTDAQSEQQASAAAPRRRRSHRHSESSHGSSANLAPLHRKDIFYSGSLQNIPMYRSQPDVYIATVAGSHGVEVKIVSEKGEKKAAGCLDLSEEFRTTMKDMLSVSLLKNPVFLMFAFSNFFTSIGFNMPFIFLPDRAKLAGIDEDKAALLLSVIGIANTAGRVIFGFLSDRPWVNRLMLYNTALTICGVATALSPVFGGDYTLMVVYAAVFGVFIGVYVSLTSVVLVDLLGLEYLTNSFGLLLLFQGAATFVGPPIAGWLCDWTGSYDISFILMGALIALSGIMLFFLPCVERYYERRIPKEIIVHDIELGKHTHTKDVVEILSIEQAPSEV
ncbi:unnamed protein product [Candidula unifasciata]|uniref:Major facilitator superfamily (MFS) profile domain-containing protein n=1 Tax=Candidula unifasciata TaxID=100452 RepID=A0A8S3YTB1_9EUPU|nr:unnamed protein product [Candidula unifasciata]